MAKHFTLASILSFFLLATTFATSARILDDVTPPFPLPADSSAASDLLPPPTVVPNTNAAPEITPIDEEPAAPATAPAAEIPNAAAASDLPPPQETAAPAVTSTIPNTNAAPEVTPIDEPAAPATAPAAEIPNAAAATQPIAKPAAAAQPVATTGAGTFSFFMHDILGGSHPSGRAVAGIVANSDANNLPFSKPSNPIFPINGGVPLNTINGVINNNNFPSLVGLNGNVNGNNPNTLIQSNGNNAVAGGNNNQAFVTAGQLPQGLTLQQLMFGSITVVDNEITEGHELGSGILGKAQGIYITSSSDGSSHTVVLTAAFHGHDRDIDDTISFFGVHRTATPISHIAVVGGTGKYENAKGYAAIEALPHVDQHTTDGLETITHFTVYLTPSMRNCSDCVRVG